MTTLDLATRPAPRSAGRVERFDTIVVGGGRGN